MLTTKARDPTAAIFKYFQFTHRDTPALAFMLTNTTPDKKPTKFILLSLKDALRWNQACGSGAFAYSTPIRSVVYYYRDPDKNEGKTNGFVILPRFVLDAPPYTFVTCINGNKYDLLPDNWTHYQHSRGNPLTAADQLMALSNKQNKNAPSVPMVSRLVDPVLLDWNTWTLKT